MASDCFKQRAFQVLLLLATANDDLNQNWAIPYFMEIDVFESINQVHSSTPYPPSQLVILFEAFLR